MKNSDVIDVYRDRRAIDGSGGMMWLSIAVLLLFVTVSLTCEAQLRLEIRQPVSVRFDAQTKRYVPEDVSVRLTVLNTSPDSAFHVQLDAYTQMRLQFADGSSSQTLDIAEVIPPGDSVSVHLPLRVVKAPKNGQREFYYPQQLLWNLRWELGGSYDHIMREGHAVAVVDSGCPDGMIPGLAGHLVLKDTVRLLPGADGTFQTVYEAEGCLYAADGKSYGVSQLHLEVIPNMSIFDEIVSVERILPRDSVAEVIVSGTDTIRTLYRIRIPYGFAKDHLLLRQWAYVSVEQGCRSPLVGVGLDLQPLWIQHAPGTRIRLFGGVSIDSHGGARRSFLMQSWCGTAPKGPDSIDVSVLDNGESVPLESFSPQLYTSETKPVHAIFALDISQSMGDAARRRIEEILLEWKNAMAPERDSITVFTLSDSARIAVPCDAPGDSLASFLTSIPVGKQGAFYPQLRDVVAYAREKQAHAAVSLIVATDGWFAGAEFCQDTVGSVWDNYGFSCFTFSPSPFFNYDAIPWQLTPKSVLYNYASVRWPLQFYQAGRFMYPIPCWSGRERDAAITIKNWCGKDTVILKPYSLPEPMPPLPFIAECKDTTLVGGEPLAHTIAYVGADQLRADHAEFLIEYDSSLLSLQTMSIPGSPNTVLHRSWVTPGKAHVISAVNANGSSGTLGTLMFSTTVVNDTVRTPLKISAWSRTCTPTETATIAMLTLLPATTSIEAPRADIPFSIDAVYPQPAFGTLQFDIQTTQRGTCRYRIMDLLGRICHQNYFTALGTGMQSVRVTLPPLLSAGTYLLELRLGDVLQVRRFHVMKTE